MERAEFPVIPDAKHCDRCGGYYWREECGRCKELDEWAAGFVARRSVEERSIVHKGGMGPLEMDADLTRIPPQISGLIKPYFTALASGSIPERGFGLMGGAGVGKTMAMACYIKHLVGCRWSTALRLRDPSLTRFQLRWVPWPDMAAEIRMVSTRDGGMEQVHEQMNKLARVEVLVLDDLGAERIRENYTSDFAVGLLDVVVDRRSRNALPTWWTSNMDLGALAGRYGARFMSRLTGMGRELAIPALPDLRRRQP